MWQNVKWLFFVAACSLGAAIMFVPRWIASWFRPMD